MCRALKILCAAPDRERLAAIKRASVSVHWELVGGAVSVDQLVEQVALHRPDVVVFDSALGGDVVSALRRVHQRVRVLSVGRAPGVDAAAEDLDVVKEAILGVPRTGGPVGGESAGR